MADEIVGKVILYKSGCVDDFTAILLANGYSVKLIPYGRDKLEIIIYLNENDGGNENETN